MAGRDLIGIAQTGTGKTAAFGLPILHYLAAHPRPAPRNGCRVLVLSPTRELASQIRQCREQAAVRARSGNLHDCVRRTAPRFTTGSERHELYIPFVARYQSPLIL